MTTTDDPKNLVIVGACGGMGRALIQATAGADGAAGERWRVLALDTERALREAPLAPQAASVSPAHVAARACDVSQEADVKSAFAHIAATWGHIDALVYLAGYTGECITVSDMPTAEWDGIMGTNLRGMFLTARAAAPLLQASARLGRMPAAVWVSSTFGVSVPLPGYAPYAASKAGIINLVRALATEWAPHVRVNGVAPGAVHTPFLQGGTGRNPKARRLDLEHATSLVPLKRLGQPEDIAGVLLFLLGPAAGYIHGQTIHVNGGSFMA